MANLFSFQILKNLIYTINFSNTVSYMVIFNEEKWPVVYVYIDGEKTLQDLQDYLTRFDKWLSRKECFGIIQKQEFTEQVQKKESKEIKQLERKWIRQNKPRISQYCLGMAMIMSSTEALEKWQPIASKSILNMFGCSGQVFAAIPQAEEWMTKQMQT